MSIGSMSHVEFKKCLCRPDDFRGLGPYLLFLVMGTLHYQILVLGYGFRGALTSQYLGFRP